MGMIWMHKEFMCECTYDIVLKCDSIWPGMWDLDLVGVCRQVCDDVMHVFMYACNMLAT